MTYSFWKKAQIACLFLAIFLPMQFTNAQLPFANNDQTYQETVQTVLLHPTEDALGHPIFMLNETETLKLSFDVLGDNAYTYNYTMIHCSHNWETTDLKSVEYMINAAIDPRPFADFMYELSIDNEIHKYTYWISTHPDPEDRAKEILNMLKKQKTSYEPVLEDSKWQNLKKALP